MTALISHMRVRPTITKALKIEAPSMVDRHILIDSSFGSSGFETFQISCAAPPKVRSRYTAF